MVVPQQLIGHAPPRCLECGTSTSSGSLAMRVEIRVLIGHPYYDRPYYLGPDGDAKTYFALAEALARKEREGLARW